MRTLIHSFIASAIRFSSIVLLQFGKVVKQKSCFYHLLDSVPIQNAFQELKGTWFLFVEASGINNSYKLYSSEGLVAELRDSTTNGTNVSDFEKPETHIKCVIKNKVKNRAGKRRRKGLLCLKDALEELIRPVYVVKGKKKRRSNRFTQKIVDGLEKEALGSIEESQSVFTHEKFDHLDSENEMDHREEWTSRAMVEIPGVSSSEVGSVTGIITRYFSGFDEVNQFESPSSCDIHDNSEAYKGHVDNPLKAEAHYFSPVCGMLSHNTIKTPRRMLSFPLPANPSSETSRGELGRDKVGKRLVMAASNLGISVCKKIPLISVCQSRGGKLSVPKSASLVRSLAYEIGEDEA